MIHRHGYRGGFACWRRLFICHFCLIETAKLGKTFCFECDLTTGFKTAKNDGQPYQPFDEEK
jgi:hypothetical protein